MWHREIGELLDAATTRSATNLPEPVVEEKTTTTTLVGSGTCQGD
jgi:hypothetical protein